MSAINLYASNTSKSLISSEFLAKLIVYWGKKIVKLQSWKSRKRKVELARDLVHLKALLKMQILRPSRPWADNCNRRYGVPRACDDHLFIINFLNKNLAPPWSIDLKLCTNKNSTNIDSFLWCWKFAKKAMYMLPAQIGSAKTEITVWS